MRLTFHLAGINNQNFLMRDEETGTYWQQISGMAISGPLKGNHLTLVLSDELSFKIWKSEEPQGTVLDDVPEYVSGYAAEDWDVRMKRVPTVIDFREHGLQARDLMLGIQLNGVSRAFPYDRVAGERLVMDHVGEEPVLLVVGPDNESVRAFRDRIPGVNGPPRFYRSIESSSDSSLQLMDDATGSKWDFQGCAVSGPAKGQCLDRIPMLKDYWFDWRNYNPKTTVYGAGR